MSRRGAVPTGGATHHRDRCGCRVPNTGGVIEQPVSVGREALAVALRHSTDPLALEAMESLHDEVPDEMPVWDCDRADLLLTYQERADRGRRGQGPATRQT